MSQHFMDQPQPPSSLNSAISPALDAVILRALEKEPDKRFPSILAFAQAFQEALGINGNKDTTVILPKKEEAATHTNTDNPNSETTKPPLPSDTLASRKVSGRKKSVWVFLSLVALVILVIIASIIGVSIYQNHVNTSATIIATAKARAYPSSTEKLVFHDPLVTNNADRQWREGSPDTGILGQFTAGAYHVSQSLNNNSLASCYPTTTTVYSNMTFEVQMTIVKGDCGGIVFRGNLAVQFYLFEVCSDRTYDLWVGKGTSGGFFLAANGSSLINGGFNQLNVVAVVTIGSNFVFYVNHNAIARINDSTYSEGGISLTANYRNGPTEVAYSNATLWA